MTIYTFINKRKTGEIEFFAATNKTDINREYENCKKDKNSNPSARQSSWDGLVITIDGEITDMENI